ncbi:hypothetical protein G6F31_019737 [Rhizopus arrhizus]|nr:hypothetical protein G6F31_019737 [Rhizopus arrhizus]
MAAQIQQLQQLLQQQQQQQHQRASEAEVDAAKKECSTKNGQLRDSPSSIVFFLLPITPGQSAGKYKIIKKIRVEIRLLTVEKKPVKNQEFDDRRSSKTKTGKSAFLVK